MMDKVCCICGVPKPPKDFNKSRADCRSCQALRNDKRVKVGGESLARHKQAVNKAIYHRNGNVVRGYLLAHPCIDCGETDPVVLDFDHKDGAFKHLAISQMVQGSSLHKLFEEIAKCDVRCSNCHRRRTAKSRNWHSYLENEDE